MAEYFDEQKWAERIKKPDWYILLTPEYLKIKEGIKDRREKKQFKIEIYGFFAKHLEIGDIALGNEIGIWDSERKPVDMIIIHHTSESPGLTPEVLSAVELIRLYATYYADPKSEDQNIKGKPISSGHIRNNKQVFYPYHWIIRKDGTVERLLFDNEIGWHSGNWEVNCRSVAIVLDNDFENSRPSDIELNAIADLIKNNYPNISKDRIFGHCEINSKTICPSKLFLSQNNQKGWKEDLLSLI